MIYFHLDLHQIIKRSITTKTTITIKDHLIKLNNIHQVIRNKLINKETNNKLKQTNNLHHH